MFFQDSFNKGMFNKYGTYGVVICPKAKMIGRSSYRDNILYECGASKKLAENNKLKNLVYVS